MLSTGKKLTTDQNCAKDKNNSRHSIEVHTPTKALKAYLNSFIRLINFTDSGAERNTIVPEDLAKIAEMRFLFWHRLAPEVGLEQTSPLLRLKNA